MHTYYRTVSFTAYRLTPDQVLIALPYPREGLILSTTAHRLLAICSHPSTLDQHARNAASTDATTSAQLKAVMDLLQSFVEAGLLQRCDPLSILSTDEAREQEVFRPIESVLLVTSHRPAACERSLRSILTNAGAEASRLAFVVMDDSDCPQSRRAYLDRLQELARQRNCEIWYAGIKEKMAYIDILIAYGIKPSTARFALLGDPFRIECNVGANRNAAMCDLMGERYISFDDDVECRTVTHPHVQKGLLYSGHAMPRDTWFYKSREDLLQSTTWADVDIIHEHERLLGHTLKDRARCVMPNEPIYTNEMCSHMEASLKRGSGRVLITMSGVVGDSGMSTGKHFLLSGGSTRVNMSTSPGCFQMSQDSREILGVAKYTNISHSRFCMAYNMGMDCRDMLPPFAPIGRGEDAVFAAIYGSCFPDSYTGHLPVAIYHNPAGARKYQQTIEYRISEMLVGLANGVSAPASVDPAKRLRILGDHIVLVSNLPHNEFYNYLNGISLATQTALNRELAQMERGHHLPEYWLSALNNSRLHLSHGLRTNNVGIPAEFSKDSDCRRLKEFVRSWGELLQHWPDLLETAHYLRTKSVRISRTIK